MGAEGYGDCLTDPSGDGEEVRQSEWGQVEQDWAPAGVQEGVGLCLGRTQLA